MHHLLLSASLALLSQGSPGNPVETSPDWLLRERPYAAEVVPEGGSHGSRVEPGGNSCSPGR